MGKRFQLSLKRLHVFFLQSYFGDRGRRLWNLSSLTLGADVRRSRARPALRSACGDGPGLPVSLGPLTPTPGAAGVAQHSAAEAAVPRWSRGLGPRDVREGARAGVWRREATEGRGPPPPGRPEPEAVGSRGGGATQSQRSRQRRGVTRAAPAEAASTPPAGVTCGLVSNGLKSFRAGVVYAATAHAPA